MTDERKLPPVIELGVVSMALVIASGIYLASHIPEPVDVAPAVVLLVLSVAVLAFDALQLARIPDFAWSKFWYVAKRALVPYGIIAAMLTYVFIKDDVRGGALAVLLGSLAVFAVVVPMMLAFSVARFDESETEPALH
jgi:hypothetical protein